MFRSFYDALEIGSVIIVEMDMVKAGTMKKQKKKHGFHRS
jgi:precorrin isomerase